MCLARTVQPVVTETSSPNTSEHFRTPSADCKALEQAVRRFASHDRSTAVCSVSCGVAAPFSECLPTFRRIMVPSSSRDKQSKKNELLALLDRKGEGTTLLRNVGNEWSSDKEWASWSAGPWSCVLPLFAHSYVPSFITSFFFLHSPFPFFYPILRSSICLSFIHSLHTFCPIFFRLSRVSVIASAPINYFIPPRLSVGQVPSPYCVMFLPALRD